MSYKIFSKYYDSALGGREETVSLLSEIVFDYASQKKKFLDIGCGTAMLTKIFGENRETIGIDMSEEMLLIARKHMPSAKFICSDMRDFNLEENFDLVMAVGDSFNHISDLEDWGKAFRNIRAHLTDEGVFIFDFLTTDFLNPALIRPVILREGDGRIFLMQFSRDSENSATWIMKEFENLKGNQYALHEAKIREYIFNTDVVLSLLLSAGFNVIEVSGKVRGVAAQGDRRLIVVCGKST